MAETRWYALVEGAAQGPYAAAELAGRGADLLVCAEGASEWVAAVSIPELARVVAAGATSPGTPALASASPAPAPASASAPRFYAYIAGQMHGPYAVENLKPFLQPDLVVCREGTQDWVKAQDVPELKSASPALAPGPSPAPAGAAPVGAAPAGSPPGSPARSALQPVAFAPGPLPAPVGAAPGAGAAKGAPDAAPRDLPPLLKEFWLICRNAPDELLAEQKAKHWKQYFKNEQQIIVAELGRRGLKA